MNIRDLMTSDVQTVSPGDSVQQAAGFMLSADTGSIPVCENDKVVGMITDRDIAVRGTAKGLGPDCQVSELMSSDVICARDSDDIQSIASQMAERQVRRMPVVDSNDKLVGMVSLGDLSREGKQEAASTALEGISALGGQHQQG
ncbi:MAG: CBS domain-containing protein [Sphingomicrobium sp.]